MPTRLWCYAPLAAPEVVPPSAPTGWEGYAIVAIADGALLCWDGSGTPRLYSAGMETRYSVPDGHRLVRARLTVA